MASLRCLTRLRLIGKKAQITAASLTTLTSQKHVPLHGKSELLESQQLSLNFIRNKYDKTRSSKKQEDDSDEEAEEIDDFDKKTTVKVNVQSLRVDLLLKSGIGLARNKIETAFYESRIRINGKKLNKKSATCRIGDEIDLIRNDCPINPKNLVIARIEILDTKANEDSISVTMKRFKTLTIEDYKN